MVSLLDALSDHLARLGVGPPPPERLRLMKVSSRPGANLPVLFFLFCEGAAHPLYVAKVARNPQYPDAIVREFRNYSAIYVRLHGADLGVPQPLFCERVGAHMALLETWVPGQRCEDRFFSTRRGRRRRQAVGRFLEAAMAWAGEFHRRTRVGLETIDGARLEAKFRQPLLAFAERPHAPPRLAAGLRAFLPLLDRLEGLSWPVTAVHGDFDHGNILLDGDRIAVVDWEDCEPAGNPMVDLAYLVFHLALVWDLSLERPQRLATFFAPGGWSHALLVELLARYAESQGLAHDLFFLALPTTVVDLLTREWGPERDPRSIPLNSPDMLEFVIALCARELDGGR